MKIKLIAAFIAFSMFTALTADAQQKIGYTNINYIMGSMPEAQAIQATLATQSAQYEKLLQEKYTAFQTAVQEFEANSATMTPVILQDKRKSLETTQASIQEFQQNVQAELQTKERVLIAPVLDKIQTAIDAVANANGYTYVLNAEANVQVLLVAPEEDNITNLVLTELGVEIPTEAATAPAGN